MAENEMSGAVSQTSMPTRELDQWRFSYARLIYAISGRTHPPRRAMRSKRCSGGVSKIIRNSKAIKRSASRNKAGAKIIQPVGSADRRLRLFGQGLSAPSSRAQGRYAALIAGAVAALDFRDRSLDAVPARRQRLLLPP